MKFNSTDCGRKAQDIKAIVTDVDGVLTDGSIVYDDRGVEYKSFNSKDGYLVNSLRNMGYVIGAITGRDSKVVRRRCEELNLDYHKHGIKDKLAEYELLKTEYDLKDYEIAYIGDDMNDLSIINHCGLSAAPSDAISRVKARVDLVTASRGGEGVFREVADFILESTEKMEQLINQHIENNHDS